MVIIRLIKIRSLRVRVISNNGKQKHEDNDSDGDDSKKNMNKVEENKDPIKPHVPLTPERTISKKRRAEDMEKRLDEKEQPRRAEMKIKLRFKQRKDQMLSLLFKKDFSQTTEINETFS